MSYFAHTFLLWLWMSQHFIVNSSLESGDTDLSSSTVELDLLQPYLSHHGPVHRRNRDTQECQHIHYGNTTFSSYPAHSNLSALSHVVDVYHKVNHDAFPYANVMFHFQRVYNPLKTFSVLEPLQPGTCMPGKAMRATVQETSRTRNCIVAANAGFFNTTSGECLGNIVSDGILVQDSGGIQNVHFGITKNGHIFTGYLSEVQLITEDFVQLVGGVLWIIRDGELYVEESKTIECPDTEETGTLETFATVHSARTVVGHNDQGHVLMLQLEGKTHERGLNLYDLGTILLDLGFVNAINLDGGGSATTVINGTLVSYPSDKCGKWNCPRKVSTILCVHEVECETKDCSNHGMCVASKCVCQGFWTGTACDVLQCPELCNSRGQCQEDGCHCEPGWFGQNCSDMCPESRYGVNCSRECECLHGAQCDPITGSCHCSAGYTGRLCESACGYGFYGNGCSQMCECPDICFCDHVTGSCNESALNSDFTKAGECMIDVRIHKDNLVPDQSSQLQERLLAAVLLGVVAGISILANLWLIKYTFKLQKRVAENNGHFFRPPFRKRLHRTQIYKTLQTLNRDETSTSSSEDADEETIFINIQSQHGKTADGGHKTTSNLSHDVESVKG